MNYPGKLELHNFRAYEHATVNLLQQGLVLVRAKNLDTTSARSNGGGKTTLLSDSICWCLFGDIVYGDAGRVLRNGAKDCEVRFEFMPRDEEIYTAVRRITRGSGSSLTLLKNDRDVSFKHQKDTELLIEKLLGMDFIAFKNSTLCGQNDLEGFFGSKDARQKEILKRILRMERIERAQKKMADEAKALRDAITKAQGEVRYAEGQLAAIPSPDALLARKRELAQQVKQKGKYEKLVASFRAQIAEIEAVIAPYAEKKKSIATLRELTVKAGGEIAIADMHINADAAIVREIGADLASMEEGGCPTCGAPATDGHFVSFLNEKRHQVDEAVLDGARWKEKKDKLLKARLADAETIRQFQEEIADEQEWLTTIRSHNAEIVKAEAVLSRLGAIDGEIANIDKQLAQLAEKKSQAGVALQKAREKVAKAEEECAYPTYLAKMFGNSGLPSFLFDTVAPELTERTNEWLSILSDGYLRVEFDTQSTLKSGAVRDKFSTTTFVGGDDSPTSGGESKKIAIASRIGMLFTACAREGSGMDLIILDEILDGLDDIGQSRVESLLLKLREQRGSVYVITHETGMTEIFEKSLEIEKRNKIARLV